MACEEEAALAALAEQQSQQANYLAMVAADNAYLAWMLWYDCVSNNQSGYRVEVDMETAMPMPLGDEDRCQCAMAVYDAMSEADRVPLVANWRQQLEVGRKHLAMIRRLS